MIGGLLLDKKIKDLLLDHRESIIKAWKEEVANLRHEKYQSLKEFLMEDANEEFAEVIISSIQQNGIPTKLHDFSEKLMKLGWPLSYITDGIQIFRRVLIDKILLEMDIKSYDMVSFVLTSVNNWVEPIMHYLVSEYSGNLENTLLLQKVALKELAAPLIPVMDGITIMPLIGTIDTERAKLIMENLLEGVIKHNSEVVLIDITGVPVVDTMVAHHMIQAVEAVRIIGATAILVGIRPEIAQTIVSLGIDLGEYLTKSSLEKGFTLALKMTNRQIVTLEESDTIEKLLDSIYKE